MRHADRRGPTRRAVVAGLGLLTAASGSARAQAVAGVSDWSVIDHARMRLIDAGIAPRDPAARLVGLQIDLDPGYLTYWRSPGEAGVPPTARFAGSKGLQTATLLFPAPGRYSEDGTEAIGYKDGVVFPILVRSAEAGTPVELKLALDFAICERLCLPARAKATLALGGDGAGPEAELVRDALARVPAPARLGGAGALAITAVDGLAGDATLAVRVRTTGTDEPTMFAEAPDPWFVQAGEGLWSSDGSLRYTLKVAAKPPERAALPLRLTLVGADAAIEVPVTLDPPPETP